MEKKFMSCKRHNIKTTELQKQIYFFTCFTEGQRNIKLTLKKEKEQIIYNMADEMILSHRTLCAGVKKNMIDLMYNIV